MKHAMRINARALISVLLLNVALASCARPDGESEVLGNDLTSSDWWSELRAYRYSAGGTEHAYKYTYNEDFYRAMNTDVDDAFPRVGKAKRPRLVDTCGTAAPYARCKFKDDREKNAVACECKKAWYKDMGYSDMVARHFERHGARECRTSHPLIDLRVAKELYGLGEHSCDQLSRIDEKQSRYPYFMAERSRALTSAREVIRQMISDKDKKIFLSLCDSPIFNAAYYAGKYSDLAQNGVSTEADLCAHFLKFGIGEGRQAIESFNVVAYMQNNPDAGSEPRTAILHYLDQGHTKPGVVTTAP